MADAFAGQLPPRLAVDDRTVKKFKRGILGDEREYVPPFPLQDGEESMDMHDNNETEPRPNQWSSGKLKEAWKNSAPQHPYYFGNGEPEIANQNPNIGIPSVVDADKIKELSWPNLNVPVEEWQKYAMPYMRALWQEKGDATEKNKPVHQEKDMTYGPWMLAPSRRRQKSQHTGQVGIAPKESNMTFMATKKNGYEHSDGNNNGKDTSGNTTSDVSKRTNGGAANKNKKNNGGSRFTVLIDEDEEGEGAIQIQGLGKAHGGSTSGTKSTTRTTRTQNKKDRRTIAKGKEKSDSNVEGDKNSTRVESIHDGDCDPDKGHGSSDMDQSGHDSLHALASTPHGDFDKLKETFGLHTDDFMRMGNEAEMSDDDLCTKLGDQESPEISNCTYLVTLETTCTKGAETSSHVSLRFGDAKSNEILVHRLNSKHTRRVDPLEPQVLDDVPRKPFQACMVDQFRVTGQCVESPICYLYLKVAGDDDWRPGYAWVQLLESDKSHLSSTGFYFRRYLPRKVWHGSDVCDPEITPFGLKYRRKIVAN
ncbi:hypothetical protein BUALT_Bualt02G0054300 [Buddleja alternifolia]|uniref:Uncharacterized protein n=1 Tax=Buddleja alternifolia TaxID=168488 RepID=A0AAV6Y1X1_9LAMI|nr:hypothetical protein BUALT_Bualt02G0054300 [Buddleja alternifolia]